MKLKELSLSDVEQVRQWRNESLVSLRTPFLLTQEMQSKFYSDVVCNRQSNARYWGIVGDNNIELNKDAYGNTVTIQNTNLIGMCGLENISWENRNTEISIILNPECQGKGYGSKAVELLLDQGFNYLNLENIWGECYKCSSAIEFWQKIYIKYSGNETYLPNRKYWNGIYYDSLYFNINKSNFNIVKERDTWLK